ncbi:class I tRNA ligase family protein [Azospirillum soli]|uniref:class I tRNA ligase family protein n=1 Tax=Azospirillum soli TaxID=1304799 RepID=UPI001AE48B56|nr:class I tRNA ligase family protein [Azospirillum soli]MBP2314296.1 methionyl-tRNA synthetase [Azospirillum soli]
MTKPSFIVTLPPPTPNGGLHVGHLSGPFLASDVFTKAQRLAGAATFVTSYSDMNQSYVRVTAERQGVDPTALALGWSRDILETLGTYGCDVDTFHVPDARSNDFVRALFLRLYEAGALVRKPIPFFWSRARGRFLDEAGVSGHCPNCLDKCKCGICEGCAQINTAETLLAPRDTLSGDTALELRTVDVLVLETDRFRNAIARFYAENPRFRTRYRWVVEDALRGPLPDFPVTVPGDWGIAIDHPHFPGQVVNAWAEVMADFVFLYEQAAGSLPDGVAPRVINFFGFDNSYFYAVIHVGLLAAGGLDRWMPHATVINEFYNLDHAKFSTSANHVIWARDLAQHHDPDLGRFYAAMNTPGFEKGNFNERDMTTVVEAKLNVPWRRLAALFNQALDLHGPALAAPEEALLAAGRQAVRRIHESYGIERFHLRQAAEDTLHLVGFILDRLESLSAAAEPERRFAGVAFLVQCLAAAAYPVMPRVGRDLFARVSDQPLESLDFAPAAAARALPDELFTVPAEAKTLAGVA